ncbi:MDR family MFS transporter [Candidatus Bipolaricaulota bacterium]
MTRKLVGSYPKAFWVIALADVFTSSIGHMLVFPFLAFYAMSRFDIGMTQVGILFTAMAVCDLVGAPLGGAFADRYGRKMVLVVAQFGSGLLLLLMGLVGSFPAFFTLAMLSCLVGSAGGPARSALMTDILPGKKLPGGYGVLRVLGGIAFVVGPLLGGTLAMHSYTPLFVIKFATNALAAAVVAFTIRETKPACDDATPETTALQSLAGYRRIFRDAPFLLFLGASMLVFGSLGQVQRGALSIYLQNAHGVSVQAFGGLMSLNGALCIAFQIPIARLITRWRPMVSMGIGTLLITAGFWVFGGASSYGLFVVAMLFIAAGKMTLMPTNRLVIAQLSPLSMRGRYIGAAGVGMSAAQAVGPVLSGLVMDHLDPRFVWYGAGVLGLLAVLWFILLRNHKDPRLQLASSATSEVRSTAAQEAV